MESIKKLKNTAWDAILEEASWFAKECKDADRGAADTDVDGIDPNRRANLEEVSDTSDDESGGRKSTQNMDRTVCKSNGGGLGGGEQRHGARAQSRSSSVSYPGDGEYMGNGTHDTSRRSGASEFAGEEGSEYAWSEDVGEGRDSEGIEYVGDGVEYAGNSVEYEGDGSEYEGDSGKYGGDSGEYGGEGDEYKGDSGEYEGDGEYTMTEDGYANE